MTSGPIGAVAKAAGQRVVGSGPGVIRALVAASIVGVAAGVLTYRLLRSG
jgi:hypothetical protein